MELVTSRSIPGWVAQQLESAFERLPVRQGEVHESYRSARWDIVVQLNDGTEVLAWVDRFDQTPARVEVILKQAMEDAGLRRP
jgi:hypothetical protein